MQRPVTLIHPDLASHAGLSRLFTGLSETHTIIYPSDLKLTPVRPPDDRATWLPLPQRRTGRFAGYAGLGAALRRLRPDIVNYHGDPASLLAVQLARFCRAGDRCAFALELEHVFTMERPWPWRLLARTPLVTADVVIARHLDGLAYARGAGFDGVGAVAPAGIGARAIPDRSGARMRLRLLDPPCPVFGFAAPLTVGCGALELLEAVAACDAEIVVLITGHGPLRPEIMARAAALDVEHRIRLLDDANGVALTDHPDMIAAIDALLVLPTPPLAYREPFDRTIELAQAHAVPVICALVPGLPEIVGDGGWCIPAGDAGALFQLLRDLAEQPERLTGPRRAALQQSVRRQSAGKTVVRALTAGYAAHVQRPARVALSPGSDAFGSTRLP